jgi:hypothetical protein
VGGGRIRVKGMGGLIWCKYCVYMHTNGKMRSIETISRLGGGENKGDVGEGKFKYI